MRIKEDYDEYPSIRQEIIQWQTVRFTLITVSSAAVAAVIGFALNSVGTKYYIFISSLLLVFLCIAVLLTWYAGVGNVKMGTYLAVFYEEEGKGWHRRHSVIKKLSRIYADKLTLNVLLAIFYLVLGIASLLLSLYDLRLPWILLPALLFLLLFGFLLLLFSIPSSYYRALWRILKNAEELGVPQDKEFEKKVVEWVEEYNIKPKPRLTKIAKEISELKQRFRQEKPENKKEKPENKIEKLEGDLKQLLQSNWPEVAQFDLERLRCVYEQRKISQAQDLYTDDACLVIVNHKTKLPSSPNELKGRPAIVDYLRDDYLTHVFDAGMTPRIKRKVFGENRLTFDVVREDPDGPTTLLTTEILNLRDGRIDQQVEVLYE